MFQLWSRFNCGIGDVLLEVESVISVERLDISRSSVVRGSLRIPIRGKGKVTVGVTDRRPVSSVGRVPD